MSKIEKPKKRSSIKPEERKALMERSPIKSITMTESTTKEKDTARDSFNSTLPNKMTQAFLGKINFLINQNISTSPP